MAEDKFFWAQFKGLLLYDADSRRFRLTSKGHAQLGPLLRAQGFNYQGRATLSELKAVWVSIQLQTIKMNQRKALDLSSRAREQGVPTL